MLQKLKIPIIIVVTAILTQLAGYAVHAAMPDALLPAGTTRYATASASSVEQTTYAAGWLDLPGMTKYITIPTGKTADVIVVFCGEAISDSTDLVSARALIRDVVASPSEVILVYDFIYWSNRCGVFYKANVAAGSPAVKIQWRADGSPLATAAIRTRQHVCDR